MSPRAQVRPPLLRAVPAVVLLALVAACGGSDEGSDGTTSSTTTTTEAPATGVVAEIAESLLDDEVAADESEARCAAERFVDELGEEGAKALDESSDELDELPDDQVGLVRTAFNDCISGSLLGTTLVTELYDGMGVDDAPEAVVDCVSEHFDGKVGDAMIEFSQPTEDPMPQSALAALEDCVPAEDLSAVLAAQFEESGATAEQARCAADGIAERITIGQFAEIGLSGGEISPEIQAILTEEVTKCGGNPAGG
jgi:hypothetical protein